VRVHEMRDLSPDDLKAQILEVRKEIVQLRFQLAARKLESPAKLKVARRQLSRLLTIEAEKAAKADTEKLVKLPQVSRSVRTKLHDMETSPCRGRRSSIKSRMTKSVARRIDSLKAAKAKRPQPQPQPAGK
jgi:large subunit ribosomal protein L29